MDGNVSLIKQAVSDKHQLHLPPPHPGTHISLPTPLSLEKKSVTAPVLICIRCSQTEWMFGLPAWKVPLLFAPSLKRKHALLWLCFDFMLSVVYWNIICACSMSLFCQQDTHSLNDIFNLLYRVLMSIYIDSQTF